MIRDDRGVPIYLQGIAFDITARKQAEEELKQSREYLEAEVLRRTAELAETNRALVAEIAERRGSMKRSARSTKSWREPTCRRSRPTAPRIRSSRT